jgi:hypothetical protein
MSEAQHVGEFQAASDGSNDGNVFKDSSAFQSIRNQLADSDEAHIGIYARSELTGAVDLRPTASRSSHETGIWVARTHTW